MKKILIVGATSAIADQCARIWLQQTPCQLALVGRDQEKLNRQAQDLRIRSPQSLISTLVIDFSDATAIDHCLNQLYAESPLDTALVAHGMLPDQQRGQADLQYCKSSLEINAISPVLFTEAIVTRMQSSGQGTIGVIGSVAGDRGRQSNYIYGAAKGLIEKYVQGLQHRLALAHSLVKVVLIKPGPTQTPMTAHLDSKGLAPVEQVAQDIVKAMARGQAVCYAPSKWRLIMAIVRNVPAWLFHKTKL